MSDETKTFYRAVSSSHYAAFFETWMLLKETPSGYWVRQPWDHAGRHKRWFGRKSRNRFARETKEEALKDFIHRKHHHIWHLERNLGRAKESLAAAESMVRDGLAEPQLSVNQDFNISW